MKVINNLIIAVMLVMLVILSVATFIEKYDGLASAHIHIYAAKWFVALWMVLFVLSVYYIMRKRLFIKRAIFFIHVSLLLILVGAGISYCSSQKGTLQLFKGEAVSSFADTDNSNFDTSLPFMIRLDKFEMQYYPGTRTPSDFISYVPVFDGDHGTSSSRHIISMNHILSYRGYRFYQSSYDAENNLSILSVNYDPWGIPVTYTGYFLLFISFIWWLLMRDGSFRTMLRHPILKKTVFIVAFLLSATFTTASSHNLTESTVYKLMQLQVVYNGRVAPLQTLAGDLMQKLSGKSHYRELSSSQFLCRWIFDDASVRCLPVIKFKNNAFCRDLFITSPAAYDDFFTEKGRYRLETYWQRVNNLQNPNSVALNEIDEKIQLIGMLRSGTLLKIFPFTYNEQTQWYAPTDKLPTYIPSRQASFIKYAIDSLKYYYKQHEEQKFVHILRQISSYQQFNGGTSYLPKSRIKAEMIYDSIPFATILYRVNLCLGLLALLFAFRQILYFKSVRHGRLIHHLFYSILLLSFLFLTAGIALRLYVTGELPLTNGLETMMMISWVIMLMALILQRRVSFIIPFGFLMSGFCMLVASLGQMNPQITNLMPVLKSPLLSIHVSMVMMAYALLAFTFFVALIALVISSQKIWVEQLTLLSHLFLYPAIALLGGGIFVGAIWANVSWGQYWSRDSKEVWALISFIVYAAPMHKSLLPWLNNKPWVYHLYMVLAFTTVLMTYFGVNYFLGGMHSYANN